MLGNLKRHHSTEQHATALQQLGVETTFCKDVAPSMDHFGRVLQQMTRSPKSLSSGIHGMGGRRKVASLMQCLGFAAFEGDRRFLRECPVICAGTLSLGSLSSMPCHALYHPLAYSGPPSLSHRFGLPEIDFPSH